VTHPGRTRAGGRPGVARPDHGQVSESGPWTVLRLIRWSTEYLAGKDVESARLDAEHLLAHSLRTTRLQLYLQYDRPLTPHELDLFRPLLRRRAAREPLQYIVGRTGFRELELKTDARALIPRPETEVLVDTVLSWAGEREGLVAVDVGTGTGCIALSLALEGSFHGVWAVDISPAALELGRENAESASLADRVRFVLSDGLSGLPEDLQVDVIVSNPPYVATTEASALEPEIVAHEPHEALFAGDDGLAAIRPLVAEAPSRLRGGGLLALEVGVEQPGQVLDLIAATGAFRSAEVHRDLAGRPRIVTAERRDSGADH
jgi:release factor glutamine methyltransferase